MQLNKLAKKIFAAGLAVSLMMANAGVSFAEPFSYTGITPADTKFTKVLDLGENKNIPAIEFKYTIEASKEKIDGTSSTFEVLPGIGTPSITTAAFEGGTVAEGATSASKDVSISFEGITFTEPGVYRYIINETDNKEAYIKYDEKLARYLDVIIIDDNGALKLGSYYLHDSEDAPKTDGSDTKSAGYTNEYLSQDLTISKTVSGNQASRDKYFKFDVSIENLPAGNICTVDISGADATTGSNAATLDDYEGKANPTSITASENGSATATFYLQHGQSVVIKGLAKGAAYTVTETPEEYTTDNAEITGTIGDEAATAAFTNTKEGTIPTGVILDSAPFILIIGLAAAALVITAARKKSR